MSTLIFGGAGSLGTELTRNILKNEYEMIHIASRDEAKHWELKNTFQNNSRIKTYICDVRNEHRVKEIFLRVKPDTIIIAQALKQVDTCEYFPEESVDTNIIGVKNIFNVIKELGLSNIYTPKEVCFVSTDKACGAINVYGMCKSIAEKLTFNISKIFKENNIDTKFIVTRYGNVISSKGSIIPLFIKQAIDPNTKSFTVTHPEMTRFMMTLQESVDLIFYAIKHGESGDLWVPKLPSMNIKDLAEIFSETYGKDIKIIGIRPGEKLHEIMLNDDEDRRSCDHDKKYMVIKEDPEHTKAFGNYKEYSSKDYVISKQDLKDKLFDFIVTNKEKV